MKKSRLRRVLDIAMILGMPCLMAYDLIGEMSHEILGICMITLFLVHHLVNRGWHRGMLKGRQTPYRLGLTALDLMMTVLFLSQACTGILMAKHLFPHLPHVGRQSAARTVHLLGAYWGLCLTSVHAGMHGTGMVRRWKAARTGIRTAAFILVLLAAGLAVRGFLVRGLWGYMTLREAFVFFDYEEPLVLFFADYAAIMAGMMLLGLFLGSLLQHLRKNGKQKLGGNGK